MSKVYIISGVGYSFMFNTAKERREFNKQVDKLFNQLQKDERFSNAQALHTACSIAVGKHLNIDKLI